MSTSRTAVDGAEPDSAEPDGAEPDGADAGGPGRPDGAAFLLTQLGAHAAERFGRRVAELDLSPPLTGVLRLIAREPGRSQQSLASVLGVLPSKVVALVDDLERRGLLERRRNPRDRRLHALHLTAEGRGTLGRLREVVGAHEADVLAPLDATEREHLERLLRTLAAAHGLEPGVHPGYRRLGEGTGSAPGGEGRSS